jgi:anti-anti-sigma regulatory factor
VSLHFHTHFWLVQDLDDATLVKLTAQDIDAAGAAGLADELFALAQESGRPHLHLDFAGLRTAAPAVAGELSDLESRLLRAGGRLVLRNLGPGVAAALQGSGSRA